MNPKTVIRAGYGRIFDIGVFGSVFGHVVTQNLPVLANQSISNGGVSTDQAFCIGSPADNQGCDPANNGSTQPAGGGPVLYTPVPVPSSGLLPNPGALVNTKARPNPMRFPTLDAWNFTVQRALTSSLTLTAAYVGNKGTHTLVDGDGNNTNPNEAALTLPGAYSVNGQTLHWDPTTTSAPDANGGTSNSKYLTRYYGGKLQACGDANYSQPTGDPLLQAGQCGWTQGISYYGDDQNTHFNALQVTLAQANWHGLNANFNYQFAHATSFQGNYNTWSKQVAFSNDSNVRHHSATLYGSYQLPVGKGKDFLTGANHLTDLIVGGFELSGTMNVSSGLPFSLSGDCSTYVNTKNYSDLDDGPCHPNQTHGLSTKLSSFKPGSGWTYYTAQGTRDPVTNVFTYSNGFSDAGIGKFGNSGNNTAWGPSFFNTDLSIQKSFNIWEHVDVKFRMDAVNAVNHINPGNPGGNITSDGSITGEAPGPGPRQLEFSLKATF